MPEIGSLFKLFYWFQLRPGPPSVLYWVLAGFYVAGLGGSAAYFINVRQRFGDHTYRLGVARRILLAGGILCAFGLIFVAMRFWGIPILSLRFWALLVTLGAVGLAGFLAYYFTRMFPGSLQTFEAEQLRQRYLPRPKGKSGGGGKRKKRK